MKDNKGFSLAEMIATIIILGLIASTTVFVAQRQVNKSKKNGFKEDLRAIIRATEIYKEDNDISDFTMDIRNLDLTNLDSYTGNVILSEGIITISNVTNGKYCGNGTSDNLVITEGTC